jgi:hypothetical protein
MGISFQMGVMIRLEGFSVRFLVVAAGLCIFLAANFACEEAGGNIEIVNQTNATVTILSDGQPTVPRSTLLPGQTTGVGTVMSGFPTTISAQTESGRILFSRRFTWDEMNEADWRIVIECPSATISTTPSPTPDLDC